MKWLLVILPLVIKRFVHFGGTASNPLQEVKNFIAVNAFKVFVSFSGAIAIGMLFSTGIILTVINLTAQYDAGFQPRFTAIIGGGLGLIVFSILLCGIGLIYINSKNRSESKKQKLKQLKAEQTLEESIMALVNDFIQEREFKRTHNGSGERNRDDSNHRSSEEFERH